jgi:phosphoglycerol transferase MdoB-like AlkP superfamily enzyme
MSVFALASYLIFLALILWKWKNDSGFLFFIMIVVYLFQGFFNIDVVPIMPLFWIVMGLSLALKNRSCSPG